MIVTDKEFLMLIFKHQCVEPDALVCFGFNGFSVAVYCILMIYQKKLSMPRKTYNLVHVCQILQRPLC